MSWLLLEALLFYFGLPTLQRTIVYSLSPTTLVIILLFCPIQQLSIIFILLAKSQLDSCSYQESNMYREERGEEVELGVESIVIVSRECLGRETAESQNLARRQRYLCLALLTLFFLLGYTRAQVVYLASGVVQIAHQYFASLYLNGQLSIKYLGTMQNLYLLVFLYILAV